MESDGQLVIPTPAQLRHMMYMKMNRTNFSSQGKASPSSCITVAILNFSVYSVLYIVQSINPSMIIYRISSFSLN